ncbi:MAG: type I-U CRISPR-associated helicase/endonuclease Cas3 [Myxococcaceae bacterium]
MSGLAVEDFDAFFEEVNGNTPFEWQRRLAKAACAGKWPETISVPTGAGKTACIDIGVFALALSTQGSQPAPRRIVMVVDRRVVVDQSHRRAQRIVNALTAARKGSVTERVKEALSGISSGAPLQAVLLRGAVPRDDNWASTPDQPLVISSTVDQVGSRLLFRGYGISPSMWPIHAGLLGTDCLYLLDEVHLAQPFWETLGAVQALTSTLTRPADRFRVVSLSATPGATASNTFTLTEKERAGRIGQRLEASKPTTLDAVNEPDLPKRTVAHTTAAIAAGASSVLVVHNRVQRAIDSCVALRKALEGKADVELLTGRMRPIDRDERVAAIESRITSGRKREAGARPLVVVATQCIEAGADFDFDSIVTELAPLDALRQRFGRVDRLGEYGHASGTVIEVRTLQARGDFKLDRDDAVYGGALLGCLKLLKELAPKKGKTKGVLDFGVVAMDRALSQADESLLTAATAEKPSAPPLFPAHLDLLAQTRPAAEPEHTPDLGRLLHGPPGVPDVMVVWREDIDGVSDEIAVDRINALPPCTMEAVSVPFVAALRWLQRGPRTSNVSDVEGRDDRESPRGAIVRTVFRWRSAGAARLTAQPPLQPGDTLVVPSSAGGLWAGTFAPDDEEPVRDRAEEAARRSRGQLVLRCELRRLSESQGRWKAPASPAWVGEILSEILEQGRPREFPVDDDSRQLRGRRRLTLRELVGDTEATTDDETSLNTGVATPLAVHSADVERWARLFAKNLRLPSEVAASVSFAGWLHDVGKADVRFQRLLRDGTEASVRLAQRLSPGSDWLLAKSALAPHEMERARLARRRSGYPIGARHEVLSTAMCDTAPVRAEAVRRGVDDFDLVLHLIASHHGWCRPFAPTYSLDGSDLQEGINDRVELKHGDLSLSSSAITQLHRLDSGLAERFDRLTRKYGWHQLAALEAVLRLADHRASEEEATANDGGSNADA